MAHFDPSELDGNSDYKMTGDDEKKMANDLNLGFNEMEAIREEIKKKQPLVSDVVPLKNLLDEFKEQPNFRRQIQTIIDAKTHSDYRPMRQDGNCFYRAFLLALFETIEKSADSQLLATVSEQAMSSLHRLLKFHYESFTIEDFYDTFMDELKWLQKKMTNDGSEYKADDGMGNTSTDRLRNEFHSQSLIFWARMLASVHIQENKDDFAGFIQGKSLHEFIKSDVEALHAEADHPQFSALSAVLNVPFRVYCLENIDKGGPQIVHSLGENRKPVFDLIFRPGHYDIIYRSQNYDAIVNAQMQQTMGSSFENNNNNNNNNEKDKNNNANKDKDKDKDSQMKSNDNANKDNKINNNNNNNNSNSDNNNGNAKANAQSNNNSNNNGNGNNAKNNNSDKSSQASSGKLNGNT